MSVAEMVIESAAESPVIVMFDPARKDKVSVVLSATGDVPAGVETVSKMFWSSLVLD